MKKLLAPLILSTLLCSCMVNRNVSGVITKVEGRNVTVDNAYTFKILNDDSVWIGKPVTFKRTVNRSKINSRKLN